MKFPNVYFPSVSFFSIATKRARGEKGIDDQKVTAVVVTVVTVAADAVAKLTF